MLTIKYVPNILSQEGRISKEVEFNRDKTVLEYLTEAGIDTKDMSVVVTGQVVQDLNSKLNNGDEIMVLPQVEHGGGGTWSQVIGAVLVVVGFVINTVTFGVGGTGMMMAGWALIVGGSIYNAVTMRPPKPSFGTIGEGLDEGSPTYSWDGIQTQQAVGVPVPIVYGTHRVGGNVINSFVWTDGDKNYLNMLLALCEGEIDSISSIMVNDNPIANFSGVTQETKMGTNTQTVISNFEDLHNEYTLNVPMYKDDVYIYTTHDSDVEGFEIEFNLPNGLFQQDTQGQVLSWSVTYNVQYKLHTNSVYIDLGNTTISGLSRTSLRRVFQKLGLTAGQYDIKITRTSDNSALTPYTVGDLVLFNIDEIKTDDLTYPNTALLGLKLLATDQLSGGSPNVTCIVKGKKVLAPNILTAVGGTAVAWDLIYWDSVNSQWKLLSDDSVLYWDGTTYVAQYCANPIWCLKDLLLNTRYGLGEHIVTAQLDTALFLEMAKYCDEKVANGNSGYEKRFVLDVVIDSSQRALDLLAQLSMTFRGLFFYSGGAIKVRIDKAETPVQLFGMGNIVSNGMIQSWKSLKNQYNVIDVQYLDATKDYKNETVSVIDETALTAGDAVRKKTIRVYTTRASQAIREGRYQLWFIKYVNRTISLKCGIDALGCQVGDVINVSHDVPQWGFSGRVQTGSTTTQVKLDRSVTIEAGKTYHIIVRINDVQEEKVITDSAGTYTEVNVSVAFSQAPANYDVYAFGEVDILVKPYRVLAIKRDNKNEVELSAIEYNASVYDDSAPVLPTSNYSALSSEIPSVTNLYLTERIVKMPDGTIEDVIDVWFNTPDVTSKYVKRFANAKIFLSDDGGLTYNLRGQTSNTHFAIQGGIIDLQTYKIAVVSVAENGEETAIATAPMLDITVIGKSASPDDVTGFKVIQDGDDLVFSWFPNPDIDLFGYEIREGDTWEYGVVVETDIQHTAYRIPIFQFGVKEYHIKAIDTTRHYSETEASSSITISKANFIENIGDEALDTWANGTLEGSDLNIKKVVNSSLEQVVDSTGEEVTSDGYIGFEVSNLLDSVQVVDSADNNVVDSLGNLVEQELYLGDEFLRLVLDDGKYLPQGVFVSEVIDLSAKMNARITVSSNIEGVDCNSELYIRISDDNSTWSEWSLFANGEYACRYYQIKLIVTTNDTSEIARVFSLKSYVTVRIIFDGDQDVEVVNSKAITFNKSFLTLSRVYAIAEGAYECEVSNKTLSGFTASVKDKATGNPATANVDWLAQGY